MIAALALTAALFYGAADFLGGLASRRTPPLRVLLISAPVGLVPLVVVAPVLDGVLELVLWLVLEPQPASATVSAITATAPRMDLDLIGLLMPSQSGRANRAPGSVC